MVNLPWRAEETTQRREFLSEFNPQPPDDSLHDTIRRRTPDTCAWILQDTKVKEWIDDSQEIDWSIPGTDRTAHGIHKLWLYGFFGCGKKFIAATIIEDLAKRSRQNPRRATCFHFCSISKVETISPINIIRNLVAQLAPQSEDGYELFRRCVETGCSPTGTSEDTNPGSVHSVEFDYLSSSHLAWLFECLARHFDRVFIVISDVDQCDDGHEQRDAELVEMFTDLVDNSDGVIKAMVTTANNPVVQQMCMESEACPVYVAAREEDIRNYVRDKLDKRITRGQAFLDDEEFTTWLEEYLAVASNGAWQWAACELINQCDLKGRDLWQPKDFDSPDKRGFTYGPYPEDRFTATFPYGPQFDRILRTESSRTDFILERVLTWIWVGADWPVVRLTVRETCEALSLLLRQNTRPPQGSPVVEEAELLGICAPLVRIAGDADGLEFSHSSVHGYLHQHIAQDRPHLARFATNPDKHLKATAELAELCFRTLANPELIWRPSTLEADREETEERRDRSPLYAYAASKWGDLSQGQPNLTDAVLRNLRPGSERLASWVLEYVAQRFPEYLRRDFGGKPLYSQLAAGLLDGSITPLHIGAALSLPNACWEMHKESHDTDQNSVVGAPLYCALSGNVALCPALEEPPWRRFRHYTYQSRIHLGETVRCVLDLGADCSVPVPRSSNEREMVSIASQALYTSAWLDDASIFIRIMESGAPYDGGLSSLLRSREFMLDPRSLMVRPVRRSAQGAFRDFLNHLYSYLLEKLSWVRAETWAENPLAESMYHNVCSNILLDDLECASEIASAEQRLPSGNI